MSAAWTSCVVSLCAGCLPATIPRGGGVVDAGDLRLALAFTGTLGGGTLERAGHTDHGNSALYAVGGGDGGAPLISVDVQLSFGVGAGCELGAALGVLKLGPEVRCRLVTADPTPVAVAGGAYWKLATGTEVMLGLESGVRFPLDAYVSYGEQRHMMVVEDRGDRLEPAVAVVRRRELRVTGAFAATVRPDGTSALFLGIAPYVTVAASPPDEVRCEHCSDPAIASSLDERFGVGFAVGATMP